jgi:formimidoylglutamate deiminase
MKLLAAHALLPEGWASDVLVEIDGRGRIAAVNAKPAETGIERIEGFVIPGMANLHSHAFQRAMAGFNEARTHRTDSFWTWRDVMYRFAARITPEQVHDVAAHLYVEMLKGGFTAVGEFHYLHHDAGGVRFADRGETSHRLIAAAAEAGIAIAHLPVLYAFAGFGGQPPLEDQARFVMAGDEYAALLRALHERYWRAPDVRIGAAFHSLRAVDPALVRDTLAALDRIDDSAPIHIHVAEQRQEVDECIAWSGQRPVEWLLEHARVGPRWCLVHATHLDAREISLLAASGAVAGLCPTTEANLGDGVFPAVKYLGGAPAGRFGIGSDSHVTVSAADELRILEYGQRLTARRRAVLATKARPSPGERLYLDAASGGAAALGFEGGRIAAGCRADLVVLDPESPALWNKAPANALDAWIFAGGADCVRDVMVGGSWRIRDRRHPREAELAVRFRAAQAALIA